nr:unnamed protein product [Digitaria exilis]
MLMELTKHGEDTARGWDRVPELSRTAGGGRKGRPLPDETTPSPEASAAAAAARPSGSSESSAEDASDEIHEYADGEAYAAATAPRWIRTPHRHTHHPAMRS